MKRNELIKGIERNGAVFSGMVKEPRLFVGAGLQIRRAIQVVSDPTVRLEQTDPAFPA